MKGIKQENECFCCSNKEDLFSLFEPHNFEENVEIYSNMIAECFQIELSSYIEKCNKHLYLICKNCVFRLRDAITFRSQIQIICDRLQVKCVKNEPGVSGEHFDVIETKEHIPEYDNTECNMNDDSEDPLSNENLLKPIKIIVQKLDNNAVKNMSTNNDTDVRSQPSKTYACNICSKLFKNVRGMKKHKTLHHNTGENFNCKYCNKIFTTNRRLLKHEKMHVEIKNYICDYCKKEFTRKRSLKDHILLHMDVRNIKCDLCDKCFVSKRTLSFHKRDCHSIKFSCNICGKTLRTKKTFDYHVLLHSGVKSQKCDICEKTFATKYVLLKHQKHVHFNTNESYVCKHCNKTFPTKWRLSKHEKIHLEIKDFVCEYCKKGFSRKGSLRDHVLLHIGIKNIECELCGKFYLCKTALANHKRKIHPNIS